MAWVLLPVNYTDAVWSGLKKYAQVANDDGTVSFQDVTVYSGKELSFFGAMDANRMNEALNTIMSMVENGTDLYEAFQNYFAAQQTLFEAEADATQDDFTQYVVNLKQQGDGIILTIQNDYSAEIAQFESTQEQVFQVWFQAIRDQLNGDAATALAEVTVELDARLSRVEEMLAENDIEFPISTDDSDLTLLVDDLEFAIMADWKYKEV